MWCIIQLVYGEPSVWKCDTSKLTFVMQFTVYPACCMSVWVFWVLLENWCIRAIGATPQGIYRCDRLLWEDLCFCLVSHYLQGLFFNIMLLPGHICLYSEANHSFEWMKSFLPLTYSSNVDSHPVLPGKHLLCSQVWLSWRANEALERWCCPARPRRKGPSSAW